MRGCLNQRTAMSPSEPTLKLSEVFDSVQGEGPSIGCPARFLRLALCNLRCRWCDSRYTWDFKAFDYAREVNERDVSSVAQQLSHDHPGRLIITGGEPMLQIHPLEMLCELLPRSLVIEVETNGTLCPSEALLERINQWNVSVKLSNSGEPARRRLNLPALETFRRTSEAWLKLVLETMDCVGEALALLDQIGWPRERALFMPQSRNRREHETRLLWLCGAGERAGIRLSPRLHLQLWDGARAK